MRVAIVFAVCLVGCQPAPKHRPELLTRIGAAQGSAAGGGASGSADAVRAGSNDAGAGEGGDDGYESTCDQLASCCATLDAIDPARAWCEEPLTLADQDVCATRLGEMAASGQCAD